MELGNDPKIEFTVEELREAVGSYLVGFSRKLERDLFEAPSFDDQMVMLEKCVGKPVRIEYADYGKANKKECILTAIEPYILLRTSDWSIPFIGSGCAVRRVLLIASNWERIVYFNQHVGEHYDIRKIPEVEKFKVETWGPLPPLKKKA
jgi:hypothetical protein